MSEDPFALGFEIKDNRKKDFFSAICGSPRAAAMVGASLPFDFKQKAFEWFRDRKPELCVPSHPERLVRLRWLSEGSLAYHLSQFTTAPPPVAEEVRLFGEFIMSNPPRLAGSRVRVTPIRPESVG